MFQNVIQIHKYFQENNFTFNLIDCFFKKNYLLIWLGWVLWVLTEACGIFPLSGDIRDLFLTQNNREVLNCFFPETWISLSYLYSTSHTFPSSQSQISLNTFKEIQSGWKEMNSLVFKSL